MPQIDELKSVIKEGLTEVKEQLIKDVVEEVDKKVEEKFASVEERLKKIEDMPFTKLYISKKGVSGRYKGYDLEEQGRELREKGVGIFADDEKAEEYAKFIIDFVKASAGDIDAIASLKQFYQAKSLSEGVAGSGGYLVPDEFLNTLIELGKEDSFALNLCTVINMTRDNLKVPKELTRASVSWTDEGAAITEGDPTFGQVELIAKKLAGIAEVTNELLDDTAIDVVGILTRQWAEAVAVELDNQVLNGTGSPFTGVLSGAGNTITMDTGNTNFSDITADNLADMEAEIATKYAKNLTYIMHRKVFNYVRKLKDSTGNYIVARPAGQMPGTIWEIPYFKSEQAPSTSAANTPFVALGNFKYYYIGKRLGVATIQKDPYGKFDSDITRFRLVTRWGAAIARAEAFSRLVTAAV